MLFAMIRKGGPGWDQARPLREQEAWAEHAEFMDELAEEGFVVLAGPLGADPWTRLGVLDTVSVERWDVLLGDLTGR
ncbi:MAG TPA: hypothetical protein VLW51_12100 [Solirubrobacteraceae bacterium]|nr:hypothetical protein [Solirubrobacteraceae bacterium]